MKKIFLSLSFAFALGLAACGNVDNKIDRLIEIQNEAKEIAEKAADGDAEASAKLQELTEEMTKISAELKDVELTEEQQKKLAGAGIKQ